MMVLLIYREASLTALELNQGSLGAGCVNVRGAPDQAPELRHRDSARANLLRHAEQRHHAPLQGQDVPRRPREHVALAEPQLEVGETPISSGTPTPTHLRLRSCRSKTARRSGCQAPSRSPTRRRA